MTLNRPKALNAFNVNMINLIRPKLRHWPDDLDMIMIEGSGDKAFCAGGDIIAVTDIKGSQIQKDFFRDEYIINNATGVCKVPYVAFVHGITMGGGVGLSVHGE